jgi:hypothetical protein
MPLAAHVYTGALKVINAAVTAFLDVRVTPRPVDDRAELAGRVDRAVEDTGVAARPPELVMPTPYPFHLITIEQTFEGLHAFDWKTARRRCSRYVPVDSR